MSGFVGPDIERAFFEGVETTDIIETHDVIGVGVCEDDGIDQVDAVGDALEAEFGGGVDEDAGIAVGNDGRGARALVVGIGAGADGAVATDHGDAGGGAGSKEDDLYAVLLHRNWLYAANGGECNQRNAGLAHWRLNGISIEDYCR
jgi:hypothetical protein